MSTRFVNGNYFSDTSRGIGDVPLWQQLGYSTKAAWKQAGRPGLLPTSTASQPSGPIATVPTTQVSSAPASSGGVLSGIESFFSGIPTTYLLIGGAIIAVMLLKKR